MSKWADWLAGRAAAKDRFLFLSASEGAGRGSEPSSNIHP